MPTLDEAALEEALRGLPDWRRDGEVLTTDGPFAETKEQMGGFFLVDCKNLDEAIELAAKLPGARHGSIEVRPIWEM